MAPRRSKRLKKTEAEPDEEKCPSCDKADCDLECEICLRWFHSGCLGVSKAKLKQIVDNDFHWYCAECDYGAVEIHTKMSQLLADNAALKNTVTNLENKLQLFQTEFNTFKAEREGEISDKLIQGANRFKEEVKSEIRAEVEEAANEVVDVDAENTNPWHTVMNKRNEPVPDLQKIIHEELNEQKQIELIRNNLTISGIAESDEGNERAAATDDLNKVKALISEELHILADIEKVVRCGKDKPDDPAKPRLLKLFMKSKDNRKNILQDAKNLRNSDNEHIKLNVYIGPDQTKKQQLESKNLRDLLRKKRLENPGKTFKIQKGQITEIEAE